MAGTFHYLFNHAMGPTAEPLSGALIDVCLEMLPERQFPLGQRIGFAEIDWFYCMNRSLRQCDHRFEESRAPSRRSGANSPTIVLGLDSEDRRRTERSARSLW